MTAPPRAPERAAGGSRSGWQPPRALLVVGVVVVALLLTDAVAQALTPYIRRDDWPYLLPQHTAYATDVYAKNLNEGRWLNWVWWLVVGQHGTAVSAALTYVAAYALFVAGFWRLVRRRLPPLHWAVDALLGLTLFASVLWVRLLYWPGTLTPSVLVAAAGVWTLPAASRRRSHLALWLLVTTVLAVLTYPPVAGVLIVCVALQLGAQSWRRLALVGLGFLLAYAVGIGVIYVLNAIAFGHPGIVVAAWRRPNPLTSLYDAKVNTLRALRSLARLGVAVWPALLVGVLAAALGLWDRSVRPRVLRVLAAVALVVGLGALQTLVTGVVTDPRGELWVWPAVVLPAALLLAGSHWSPRVGVAALAALAVIGTLTWRADVGDHQASQRRYAALAQEATALRPDGSRPVVVLYQAPRERATARGRITAGTLQMMIRAESGGVVPRWCRPAECTRIAARAPHRGTAGGAGAVVRVGTLVGVVVPHPPARL